MVTVSLLDYDVQFFFCFFFPSFRTILRFLGFISCFLLSCTMTISILLIHIDKGGISCENGLNIANA